MKNSIDLKIPLSKLIIYILNKNLITRNSNLMILNLKRLPLKTFKILTSKLYSNNYNKLFKRKLIKEINYKLNSKDLQMQLIQVKY